MSASRPRTLREKSDTTTGALLAAARELFAEHGYAGTRLEQVVGRAGVTKGALYHHFANKRDLFEAVYEEEQRRLAAISMRAYVRKKDPWEGFAESTRAFFEATLDPGVQRITLLDAPAVLGWEPVRAIQARHPMADLRRGLEAAIEAGTIPPRPLEPLVQILNAAICEAALVVAHSDDQRAATRAALAELRLMVSALRQAPKPARASGGPRGRRKAT